MLNAKKTFLYHVQGPAGGPYYQLNFILYQQLSVCLYIVSTN